MTGRALSYLEFHPLEDSGLASIYFVVDAEELLVLESVIHCSVNVNQNVLSQTMNCAQKLVLVLTACNQGRYTV